MSPDRRRIGTHSRGSGEGRPAGMSVARPRRMIQRGLRPYTIASIAPLRGTTPGERDLAARDAGFNVALLDPAVVDLDLRSDSASSSLRGRRRLARSRGAGDRAAHREAPRRALRPGSGGGSGPGGRPAPEGGRGGRQRPLPVHPVPPREMRSPRRGMPPSGSPRRRERGALPRRPRPGPCRQGAGFLAGAGGDLAGARLQQRLRPAGLPRLPRSGGGCSRGSGTRDSTSTPRARSRTPRCSGGETRGRGTCRSASFSRGRSARRTRSAPRA